MRLEIAKKRPYARTMQYEEVARHFHRKPFEPLIVRMVSGTEYRVRTPESIVGRRYLAFLMPDTTIEVVALEYVEAIRPLKSNGGRKRRRA